MNVTNCPITQKIGLRDLIMAFIPLPHPARANESMRPDIEEVHVMAMLQALYWRAGGRRAATVFEMLQRIADDSSHLLRQRAFPADFEAATVAIVRRRGKDMDSELLNDLMALACEGAYADLAGALFDAGLTLADEDAHPCLLLAVQSGQPTLVELLLRNRIDVRTGDAPLLSCAIASGSADIVLLLRKAGARADRDGCALAAAIRSDDIALVRMCLDDGASEQAIAAALEEATALG